MKDFLKHYKMQIEALSPIYIGSGTKIGTKEYIYIAPRHEVIIPDMQKMFLTMQKKRLNEEFTEFMMDARQGKKTLSQWLREHQFRFEDYETWKLYKMDAGEAFLDPKSRPKEIEAFVKDAYGLPYVPGSSIKGMLRTAIIAWELHKNPDKYRDIKDEIRSAAARWSRRNEYLKNETRELEQRVLYVLNRDDKNIGNAVNDCLSGLHVGDSEPISLSQLTLSQKIDYTVDGKTRALPLLRETIIPGTKINFDLTIDAGSNSCGYSIEDIFEALNYFRQMCNRNFYSRFKREIQDDNAVFIGGGCGFLSKTVIYSLCTTDAVRVVDNIFKNTLGDNYREHHHDKDLQLRVAPHMCKCTKYKGELYDMGIGRISIQNT